MQGLLVQRLSSEAVEPMEDGRERVEGGESMAGCLLSGAYMAALNGDVVNSTGTELNPAAPVCHLNPVGAPDTLRNPTRRRTKRHTHAPLGAAVIL